MKILITNDDSINAEGIVKLAEAVSKIANVTVVAPLIEQSAVGHAISMKSPLRIQKIYRDGNFFGYAINGTPADCVKIAIRNILDTPPDLVISGINHGGNVAINILYSGTVAGAREASIMNIPSIAISLNSHKPLHFESATDIVLRLINKFEHFKKTQNNFCLNVNVPNISLEQIKGIKYCSQGTSIWQDYYEERTDPYGNPYYWLAGKLEFQNENIISDEYAIKNDYISITPIHFDLTDYNLLKGINSLNL